jgi:mRNA interferase RelE/StbE
MSYELAIHPDAEKEWAKLDGSIKRRFKEKFAKERLKHPRVVKDALRELPDCYKIKITTPQFRLIYHVNDAKKLLIILSDASRDDVYEELRLRLL